MRKRPVVFTIDDRYIKPLAVALAGLLQYEKAKRRVYVFHEHLNPVYRIMLILWLRSSMLNLSIERMNISHKIRKLPHHFTPAILLRLLVAARIREPEFIYLDADILMRADLGRIDKISLDHALIAASPWTEQRYPLGMKDHVSIPDLFAGRPYYATGLLLINSRRFEAEKIGERCLKLISQHSFEFPDQDALNLVCHADQWKCLPKGLNEEISDRLFRSDLYTSTPPSSVFLETAEDGGRACVLQLAGSEKPWHLWNRHPMNKEFKKVLQKTPFSLMPVGLNDIRWRSLISRLRSWLNQRFQQIICREGDSNGC